MANLPNIARERLKQPVLAEHPDADLLTAFVEHLLSASEHKQVLAHLGICAQCREVAVLAMPETVLAQPGTALEKPRAFIFRWPVLRWVGAGAAACVVLAAVVLQAPKRDQTQPLASETQVAQVQSGVGREAPAAPEKSTDQVALKKSIDEFAVQKQEARRKLVAAAEDLKDERKESDALAKAQPSKDSQYYYASGAAAAAPAREEEPLVIQPMVTADAAAPSVAAEHTVNGAMAGRSDRAAGARQTMNWQVVLSQPQLGDDDTVPIAMSKSKSTSVLGQSSDAGPRWSISAGGEVMRSGDGLAWTPVTIEPGTVFRAVSANGPEIWAGGVGGVLYHSSDAGESWTRILVSEPGVFLAGDIVRVEFANPLRGEVRTSAGQVWSTRDAGRSWLAR